MLNDLLQKAAAKPHNLDFDELVELLSTEDAEKLFAAAYELKLRYIGKKVNLRGLIELGNYCTKDCYYCGIRKGNAAVERYQLNYDDVIRMAKWTYDQHYGSLVLQSGELESPANTEFIAKILRGIREFAGDDYGITLCLGEQTEEVYKIWREAGAHRYLLRIETTNPELYRQLHPADHSFERRCGCIKILKKLDYQTGTGVMSGLPGQTVADLAHDLQFFRQYDIDMLGMGPYIPHADTPLGKNIAFTPEYAKKQLAIGLKMIAVARLYLHDINIAATTALQALDETGREQGIKAGANILMPNVTDTEYRINYQLYQNKPCMDENSAKCRNCLNWRVLSIGEEIDWDHKGDSRHYWAKH